MMHSPPPPRALLIKLPAPPPKRLPWDSVFIQLGLLVLLGGIVYGVTTGVWAHADKVQSQRAEAMAPSQPALAVVRPTLFIDRVLNVSQPNVLSSSLKLHLHLAMAVEFADPSGQFARARDLDLSYLERNFAADHSATLNAFNDILTTTIDTKTPAELWSTEVKEALRQELITEFNQALVGTNDRVVYINFTDFVMQ